MTKGDIYTIGWLSEELQAATKAVDSWPVGMRAINRSTVTNQSYENKNYNVSKLSASTPANLVESTK